MAGDGEADLDLDSIVAAAWQRSPGHRGGRSPAYDLMWNHHARLAPELSRPRRPNWQAVAQALGDQGVLDGAGRALAATSAETVRKTWWKVCRDREAVAAGGGQRRPRAAAPSQAASTPSTANGMLPPGVEPAEEEPPRFTFKFARAKDWTKVADKGDE